MTLPLIIDPEAIVQRLDDEQIVIVDVGKLALYNQAHIPGARFLDYGHLVANSGRTHGLLPDRSQLEALFSSLGIDDGTHVVACDDEGGGKAARLVWTLRCAGHDAASLLNGGLHAWLNEGFPHTPATGSTTTSSFRYRENSDPVITGDEILARIDDVQLQLLDARSLAEYNGEQRFSMHAGHIPGAIHYEWTRALDMQQNLRLRDTESLQQELSDLGFDRNKEIGCYCQTHHRSSLSWVVLKHLGFEQVKGYPGSWSDWGNRSDYPAETP
jgi:thiosulfate/3-mercaptopyruvate sulfurtransferase